MTQERISPTYEVLPAFYQQLQTHPLYIDLKASLASISPSRLPTKSQNLFPRNHRWHTECRRGLDLALRRLSRKQLAGKDHIESYLRDQYRRNLRPSTMTNSLRAIESFLCFVQKGGDARCEESTRQDIEGWIEQEQDRGMKASTVNMRLAALKAFLRFLIERDVLSPELLSKRIMIKMPDVLPRAMDPDDVRQLVTVLDGVRDRAMILILLRTGMRIGELLATIVEDVNLKDRRIEIYEAGKTRVGRVVYLSDDALKALKAWLAVREPHKASLFYATGTHRHTITYPAVRAMFRKYLNKAGLSHKGYTLHCLRHTCASELLNAGMRLECVQQLLGHSSIEMTRRYARLTDKTREEEYFRAMAIIERGEINGTYQLDRGLPSFLETT
jgi:integrase/recombinase XerD